MPYPTRSMDFQDGYQAGINAERARILSAPATAAHPTDAGRNPQVDAINRIADAIVDHEANRTIEFNKGYRQGRADAAGLVAETEGYEKGWHDGYEAAYEFGYNDAFNVAANADENIDLRAQALEMAIAASAGGVYGDTVTTIAAAFLHFLKTGTPYTGDRVLNDDIG